MAFPNALASTILGDFTLRFCTTTANVVWWLKPFCHVHLNSLQNCSTVASCSPVRQLVQIERFRLGRSICCASSLVLHDVASDIAYWLCKRSRLILYCPRLSYLASLCARTRRIGRAAALAVVMQGGCSSSSAFSSSFSSSSIKEE